MIVQKAFPNLIAAGAFLLMAFHSDAFGQRFPYPVQTQTNEVEKKQTPVAPSSADVYVNSLERFVDEVAHAIEQKMLSEKVKGPLRLEIDASQGVSEKGLQTAFQPRLALRLKSGRIASPAPRASLQCRISLSRDKGRVWAVGLIEGAKMVGPSPFAVSYPVDKSLEAIFGKTEQRGQTTWRWKRIGTIRGGVLDAVTYDLDRDGIDEIVVLSVEGVQAYRIRPSDFKPETIWGPFPFPQKRIWPRNVNGWIAVRDDSTFHIATSASHAYVLTYPEGRFKRVTRPVVPIRQPKRDKGDKRAPVIYFPQAYGDTALQTSGATHQDGRSLRLKERPERVRHLTRTSEPLNAWMWVSDSGYLFLKGNKGPSKELMTVGAVGDRFVTGDFDNDGVIDVMVTGGAHTSENDEVKVYSLQDSGAAVAERFQAPLSDGFARALTVGKMDFDDRPDLVIVESTNGPQDILWRLEYAP